MKQQVEEHIETIIGIVYPLNGIKLTSGPVASPTPQVALIRPNATARHSAGRMSAMKALATEL